MQITITINADNAAFGDGDRHDLNTATPELARILSRLASGFYCVSDGFKLYDINGNRVGTVTITGEPTTATKADDICANCFTTENLGTVEDGTTYCAWCAAHPAEEN